MHATANYTNIRKVNKLGDKLVENMQIEAKRKRKDALETVGDTWDTVKRLNLCVIGVQKVK